jgi:hypothetical protein
LAAETLPSRLASPFVVGWLETYPFSITEGQVSRSATMSKT